MPTTLLSFLVLLIIAVLLSAILHYGLKFYATPGTHSFLSKVVVAYIGAVMGTHLFGMLIPGLAVGGVYLLPAMLGAMAFLVVAVDIGKMLMRH